MRLGLWTHSLRMKKDNRFYLSLHGAYADIFVETKNKVYLLPPIDREDVMEKYLDNIDILIFTGGEYLPKFSQESMEFDSFDFYIVEKMMLWLKKARQKQVKILALGETGLFINEYLGGQVLWKEGYGKEKASLGLKSEKIDEIGDFSFLTLKSEIKNLPKTWEKRNQGEKTIYGIGPEGNILLFYPEFHMKQDRQKIVDFFSKIIKRML